MTLMDANSFQGENSRLYGCYSKWVCSTSINQSINEKFLLSATSHPYYLHNNRTGEYG